MDVHKRTRRKQDRAENRPHIRYGIFGPHILHLSAVHCNHFRNFLADRVSCLERPVPAAVGSNPFVRAVA